LKKLLLAVIVFSLITFTAGCGMKANSDPTPKAVPTSNQMQVVKTGDIYDPGTGNYYWVIFLDKQTGQKYLYVEWDDGGGLTPLLPAPTETPTPEPTDTLDPYYTP